MTQSGLSSQKMKLEKIFSILVFVILTAGIVIPIVTSMSVNGQNSSAGLTNHDPIYIWGNDNFTAENGVTGGSGTKSDPYIIEGWDIKTSSRNFTFPTSGIKIVSTTVFFIIKNCEIHYAGYGIEFNHMIGGKIENCKIYNCSMGIYIGEADNNQISACDIHNNGNGLSVWGGEKNKISSCNIYNNGYGIYIYGASGNEIHYNNIYDNTDYGVKAYMTIGVDATHNWWGSADGPRGAGSGSGDAVSDGVSYDPWLKSSYEGAGIGGGDNEAFGGVWLYIIIPVIIVIIVSVLIGIKKIISPKRQTQQKQQRAQQGPQQPTQPMPSQQHVCPLCGQPLRYISEYQRWWCDNCKKYA